LLPAVDTFFTIYIADIIAIIMSLFFIYDYADFPPPLMFFFTYAITIFVALLSRHYCHFSLFIDITTSFLLLHYDAAIIFPLRIC